MSVKVQGDLSKIDIFPDDVFLASYPRSGNSWMRLLLSSYVIGSDDTIKSFQLSCRVVAEIYESSVEAFARMARPRLIKTHSAFDPQLPRVIYLVRDARDVAVSYYYYYLKFANHEISFSSYLRQFNLGQLDEFGIWSDHVNSWLDERAGSPDFLVVKYEDLKQDAVGQLTKVVDFVWGSVDEHRVEQAVRAAELSNLQKGEKQFNWFPDSNKDVAFFRSGNVGDWKSHFSEADLKTFVLLHGSALSRLGYLPAASSGLINGSNGSIKPDQPDQPNQIVDMASSDRYKTQYVNAALWESQRQIQLQLQDVQTQLGRLQLHGIQVQLGQLRAESSAAQVYAATLQQELETVRQALARKTKRVSNLDGRCRKLQRKLEQRNARIQQCNSELEAIKASKLWRLRSQLGRVKRWLHLAKQ